MFINNLFNFIKKNRKGKGESSKGKTCGRGNKGQKSRSGSKKNNNFKTLTISKLKFIRNLKNKTSINLSKINKLPLSLVSNYLLFKLNTLKKKFYIIKIFSNYTIIKNIIFYKIILSKLIMFFNFKFYLICND